MAGIWPWVAVAGVGALHGLNPATGWALAVARGVKSRDAKQAMRALLPIACGHVGSVALVAAAVAASIQAGWMIDIVAVQVAAGALLVLVAAHCVLGKGVRRAHVPTGHAAMAAWSFLVSTVQGAGLMLVPALVPICMGDASMRAITASGSVALAVGAFLLHMGAMLGVTAAVAMAACVGLKRRTGLRVEPAMTTRRV